MAFANYSIILRLFFKIKKQKTIERKLQFSQLGDDKTKEKKIPNL